MIKIEEMHDSTELSEAEMTKTQGGNPMVYFIAGWAGTKILDKAWDYVTSTSGNPLEHAKKVKAREDFKRNGHL